MLASANKELKFENSKPEELVTSSFSALYKLSDSVARQTENQFKLPALRIATSAQRQFALGVSVLMVIVTIFLLPLANVAWPRIPAFLPTFQTAAAGTCLITACLMYGHYKVTRATVLLHLSAGYFYTASILVIQFLTFPGIFIETGRLLGGDRSTSWLWAFWHIGPAASILYYAWIEHRRPAQVTTDYKYAVLQTGAVLFLALLATLFLVTVLHDSLPILDVQGNYTGITAIGAIALVIEILLITSLVFLWKASRFCNVLHVWMGIVVVTLLCDNALTIMAGSRLAMGWYMSRLIALIAFSVLMLVYLHELFLTYQRSLKVAGQLTYLNLQLDLDVERRIHYEKKLLEADRQKDEFLVVLAHELRNPLAPISTAAYLLATSNLDEAVIKKTSQMLSRQVKQMTRLVDDLIDVSRVTRGLTILHTVAMEAKQIIFAAVEQASPMMDARRHQLQVHLHDGSVGVLVDHERMVQVLTNLLNNAAKYTPPGGHIALRLEVRDSQVVFSVLDNGIGMTAELTNRAFKLFSQGELTSDRSQGGLGIGLALVKSLVELHGGHAYATSNGPGFGCEFGVVLPRIYLNETKAVSGASTNA